MGMISRSRSCLSCRGLQLRFVRSLIWATQGEAANRESASSVPRVEGPRVITGESAPSCRPDRTAILGFARPQVLAVHPARQTRLLGAWTLDRQFFSSACDRVRVA